VGLIVATALLKPLRRYLEQKGDAAEDPRVQEALSLLGSQVGERVSRLSRYGRILESLSGGLMTLDREGRVVTVNTAAEIILGAPAADLEQRPIEAGAARDLAPWAWRALREGATCSSQEVLVHTADDRRIVVGLTTSLLRDARREVAGVVLSFKDLSQLRRVQEQMQRVDRLASLGTLAAGVAHEVRNPLGSIQGLAQLLLEAFPEEDEKRRYAQVIVSETRRLNHVVEQLLSLAVPVPREDRASGEAPAVQDVTALLHRAVTLTRFAEKGKAVQIQEAYGKDLPPVRADGERLLQAFLNILLNAVQAIPEEGTVRVSADPSREAGWLRIAIANTHSRILPEDRERIFDPFYTTKADGTGLGLTIAHQAVAAHGGRLWVEGDGQWTRFVIELPAVESHG